jgi:hypothetical protein
MWPRGDLSWVWLIHHDREAGQHKIYAALLIIMGVIEYRRARGRLSRSWRTWAFPCVALAGAVLLFFHDHTAGSGAPPSDSEALKYVVKWSIGGARKAQAPAPAGDQSRAMQSLPGGTSGHHEHMMEMHDAAVGHQHHMTEAMLKVERQHIWFALVGIAVIVCKFIHDSALLRMSFVPLLWPSCLMVLGVLLVFYSE